MSTARKILSNTVSQIFGRALTALLSILIVKLITNYLGTSGYGEYVTVYSYLAFFGIAADLGLFTIAVREMAKDEEKTSFILGNILSLRTILAVSSMIVAVVSAYLIPKYQDTLIPVGVAIASVSTLLSILTGTISSVLQVHLKMQYNILGLVAGRILSFGYMAWVVLYGFKNDPQTGFIHLMIAGILSSALMLAVTYYYTRKLATIAYRLDLSFWKDVIFKALPYGIALILSLVYFQVDSILLSIMKNTTEVGIYGVPMKILEILTIIPVYFMNSVLPVLTRHLQQKSEKVKEVLQYSFDFLFICGLPIVIGGYILAYNIVFVISSPEFLSRLDDGFYGSDIGFKILIFALFFSYLNSMFGFTLVALNRQTDLLKINGAGVLFNIFSNIAVIPYFGFRGAAFTSILTELLILIMTAAWVHKYIDYRISLERSMRSFFSALVMGAFIFLLRDPVFDLIQNFLVIVLIPLGGLVYLVMLFATRAISVSMVRELFAKNP
ncbi:flippase [Candidatus Peregrinibacteria bacterium]|nr:flippase [Candidatus Peregrinibacteria bacterium]